MSNLSKKYILLTGFFVILLLIILYFTFSYHWQKKETEIGVNEESKEISATRVSYQEETPDGFPSLFQLADGTLWVIFKSKRPEATNLYLVQSKDNGKTWSVENPFKITDSKRNSEHTSIIQKDNLIMLAWDDGSEIWLSLSGDSGKTWKQKEFTFGPAIYPYINKVNNEVWYLFVTYENGLGGIIKYSIFDGDNWSEAKEIIKNPDVNGKTTIFGNPILYKTNNELWFLWDTGAESEPNSDVWWMKSFDNGKDWTNPAVITENTDGLDDVDPSICEYEGKPLLVYASRLEKDITKDYKIYYKLYGNGQWSKSVKLGEPYNYKSEYVLDWYPFCFTAKDGGMWLTWASNRLTVDRSNHRMEAGDDNREVFVAPLILK